MFWQCKKGKSKNLMVPFMVGILLVHLVLPGVCAGKTSSKAAGVIDAANTPTLHNILQKSEQSSNYKNYLAQYPQAERPIISRRYAAQDARLEGAAERISNGLGPEGEAPAILFSGSGKAEWTVTMEREGLYALAFGYYTAENAKRDMNACLKINGSVPFNNVEEITFHRYWADAEPITTDIRGNDKRPRQKQVSIWREHTIKDPRGQTYLFLFYLKPGNNTISLETADEGLYLESLRVFNDEPPIRYEQAKTDSDTAVDFLELYQAETADVKTDSAIKQGTDRTDAATMPADPVFLKLNMISGDGWKLPGQTIFWTVDVPQDGNYKIGLRYRQADMQGLFVSRRLLIDGAPPFAEAENLRFQYHESWKYKELGSEADQPYAFFLKKGRHTIGLEVVTDENGEVIQSLEECVYILNYLYRKIVVITGTSPDSLRDYSLPEEIPELLPAFTEIADVLNGLVEQIVSLTDQKGGNASILRETEEQLRSFVKDPYSITDRLDNYKSNVTALSALMLKMQEQPLDLDYITVSGMEQTIPNTKAGFFQNIAYQFKAFIGSFFNDYTSIGGNGEKLDQVIKVWYGGSREQAEIVQRMIDDSFTPQSHVGVTLELVQVSIAQAIIAGTAPDVVMNVARGQPINLAVRDALVPLDQFQGFDELKKQYEATVLTPYTFQNKVYGLPITLDYHLLFIRDDIFDELGLQVPDTWTELYDMLPTLQRSNMTVGLPYTTMSSQATVDGGMGAKDLFSALVLQRGGTFYNENASKAILDSKNVMDAFKQWTEYYQKYELPLTYDFYNRFRSGEMPMGIQGYGMYNMLEAAAPEIKGMWSMHLLPGTQTQDGKIDRTEGASGTATIMINNRQDEATKTAAWEFMKWWASAESQARYGVEIETLMGTASRYNPANIAAMEQLSWSQEELSILKEQRSWIREIPEVPGGYYTSRCIDNAFRNVVLKSENYREALLEQNVIINTEISRKRREFFLD